MALEDIWASLYLCIYIYVYIIYTYTCIYVHRYKQAQMSSKAISKRKQLC